MSDELHKGAVGEIFNFARTLRKDETEAEKILWQHLRSRRLGGYKFRRQHPIKNYIADYYCHEARLVIEVDGKIHMVPDQQVYDEARTYDLKEAGVKVIRFRNEEITNSICFVLERIVSELTLLTSSPAYAETASAGRPVSVAMKIRSADPLHIKKSKRSVNASLSSRGPG